MAAQQRLGGVCVPGAHVFPVPVAYGMLLRRFPWLARAIVMWATVCRYTPLPVHLSVCRLRLSSYRLTLPVHPQAAPFFDKLIFSKIAQRLGGKVGPA